MLTIINIIQILTSVNSTRLALKWRLRLGPVISIFTTKGLLNSASMIHGRTKDKYIIRKSTHCRPN